MAATAANTRSNFPNESYKPKLAAINFLFDSVKPSAATLVAT
jgi:hypothetical protein